MNPRLTAFAARQSRTTILVDALTLLAGLSTIPILVSQRRSFPLFLFLVLTCLWGSALSRRSARLSIPRACSVIALQLVLAFGCIGGVYASLKSSNFPFGVVFCLVIGIVGFGLWAVSFDETPTR